MPLCIQKIYINTFTGNKLGSFAYATSATGLRALLQKPLGIHVDHMID